MSEHADPAQLSLAVMTALAFFALIFSLLFKTVVPEVSAHHDLIIGLTSSLGTVFTMQMNYIFRQKLPYSNGNGTLPNSPSPGTPAKETP